MSDTAYQREREDEAVDARREGKQARRNDIDVGQNPHPQGTNLARHWTDGWRIEDHARRGVAAHHIRAFEMLRAMLRLGYLDEHSGATTYSHQQIAEIVAVIDGALDQRTNA